MSGRDDSGSGLMSSAGLVRYFDAEDRKAIQIDPKTVLAWALLFGVLVQMINAVGFGGQGTGSLVMSGMLAAFFGLSIGIAVKAATQGEV